MMSDATLPPPRSSSIVQASEAETPSNTSLGDTGVVISSTVRRTDDTRDATLVETEGRIESKQKRKRTSPEDQRILEAEYNTNPKPNKAARAEIVEKVTLNEKEVQIWFQNRRQIARRKTHPLQPHELAAFGIGSVAPFSSDPVAVLDIVGSLKAGSEREVAAVSNQADHGLSLDSTLATKQATDILEKGTRFNEATMGRGVSSFPTVNPPRNSQSSLEGSVAETSSFSITESVTRSFSSTPGYLSNRWNAVCSSFSTPSSSQKVIFGTPPISTVNQPSSCPARLDQSSNLKFSSSRVRLSMALDGKAQLISSEVSPPRAQTPRPSSSSSSIPTKRSGIQRSYSALPFGAVTRQQHGTGLLFPRLHTGRSRDARAWESACGAESRDELTAQAENESCGSAIAAINLIRSTSNTPLQTNPSKRNAPPLSHQSTQGKHGKKPKLGRATSSLGRLQTTSQHTSSATQDPHKKEKNGLARSPSGDSDKENWIPTTGSDNPRRRPLPSGPVDRRSSSKPILGENHNVPAHATNFGGPARNRKRKQAQLEPQIFEDQESGVDIAPEVERFMRGEVSPGKKGDLDCIQGLLSLSQGNWR